uniref:serine/Arginine-related protein 53-like n=1 Tax=Styela clava TaxID=7725 RepID=UPI0019399910|nr:serine/Arginine-related protein 53-like [Styela clava]
MARYSSDSDSDGRKRTSKKSKKKSKSRKRSRSTSYESRRSRDSRRKSRSRSRERSYSSDRSGRSRSRDERKRRHRSRSDDSYRSRRSRRRSRSRTRSPRRRRSKSRTNSREKSEYSRRRSLSRERSKKKKKSKKNSPERSPPQKKKDPCEDIPGFAEMTPAQQSRLRVQAAFNAAEAQSSAFEPEKGSPAVVESAIDQMERAQVIEDIEDSDFMPTHFSSSRANKSKEISKMPSWPSNLAEQEDYHEMAIFGNSAILSLDEKAKKEISEVNKPLVKKTIKWEDRDPKTLAHPNLHITHEEAENRWLEKLNQMRREKLKFRGT